APNAAVVEGAVESKEYYYPVNKRYEKSDIVNIRKMQTICMFPNISAEYEHRCKRFTYFSLDQSFILTGSINGVRSVDIGNGLFKGVIDNTGNSQNIICKDQNDGIYGKKKAPDGSEGFTYIFTTVATVPEHFINVCDMSGASCGYALNLRCEDKDVPALLESPMNSEFEIKLVSPQSVSKNDMYAYVDFGSSTSCMKYSIAGGKLIEDDIVLDKCTVRKFLTEYLDDNDYKFVINDPVLNNRSRFMSISTVYDDKIGVGDYSVYRDGWTPIVKNLSGYEPAISVSASNKTKIVKNPQVESANIIVNNICYTLACSAVARNCNEVYVVPTLPSKEYLSNIKQIWSRAISNVNDIFDIKINNVLETDDIQYLFESIAVSNGMPGQQTGTLMVSIDMGDGTTDMSAVILEAMAGGTTISHPCGQASVEYAGKNLIKQTIRDIIEHVSKKTAEDMLKGEGAFNSLFTPNNQSNEGIKEYKWKVDTLLKYFFEENTLNPPKDEAWQNKVMDILDISNLREGIDQKVAANFILRYAVLMPVIRDFVRTAIKLAGDRFNEENGSIIIDFVGGSSKGLKLLDVIDARHCAGQLVKQYFADEFAGLDVNIRGIDDDLNANNKNGKPKDGKDILIDGLKDLKIQHTPKENKFSITTDGGALVPAATQKQLDKEWRNIDTKAENLGLDVHINALNIPFKTVEECAAFVSGNGKFANAVDASITKNREIIDDPASYYKDYSSKDNPDVPVIEFTDYFNNEIFKKLIDNDDNNLDAIESLIENFVNHASGDMKSAIKRELLKNANDNSFYRATHSSIYPEMIKDTIFMFTVSKLLSEFHRGYNDHQIISDANQVGGYQFGG
ncbi:MAG: hypothetical protein J6I55_01605, partial [Ruminococcus sp.]|nr:hypothetical protein [Ruminococcus sp.]